MLIATIMMVILVVVAVLGVTAVMVDFSKGEIIMKVMMTLWIASIIIGSATMVVLTIITLS